MKQRHRYGLEKVELEIAAVAAVAVGYFLLWPVLRGDEPLAAMSLLVGGGWGRFWTLAAAMGGLSAVCAVVTVSARPQTALMAVLFGAGGLSLRSAQIRGLFWAHADAMGPLYGTLAVELLLLAGVVVGCMFIVAVVRAMARRVVPRWVWQGPPGIEGPHERAAFWGDLAALRAIFRQAAASNEAAAGKGKDADKAVARTLGCAALSLAISATLVLSIARSPDRGQILFALAGSFLLGSLIAHQVFPAPLGEVSWVGAVVFGLACYGLGAASSIGEGPQGWIHVQLAARALPLDWITAGGGGAMLGYWISARMHEARLLEAKQETQGA